MNTPRHRCRLTIFADYYQFYVADQAKTTFPEDWIDEDVTNRAKIEDGVVVICPVRNMEVPVEVEIWNSEPHIAWGRWQHIIEAPLVTSGIIKIDECTGEPQAHFSVEPGIYTVRALFRGLDTLSDDGLDGQDFYEIQIWKAYYPGLRVLKQFTIPTATTQNTVVILPA